MYEKYINKGIAIVFSWILFLMCIVLEIYARDNTKDYEAILDCKKTKSGMEISVRTNTGKRFECKWEINGKEIEGYGDNIYVLSDENLESLVEVTVIEMGQEPVKLHTYYSKLPVVYIEGVKKEEITKKEYLPATISIQENDTMERFDMQIKGRGNTSWSEEPDAKKPYKIKLSEAQNLLNLGENKHWVLIANEAALVYDKAAYDLSGCLGLEYMQSEWVSVLIDGQYRGNYLLCEQIRTGANRVNIKTLSDSIKEMVDILEIEVLGRDKEKSKQLKELMETDLEWLDTGKVMFDSTEIDLVKYYDLSKIEFGYLLQIEVYEKLPSRFDTSLEHMIDIVDPEYAITNKQTFQYIQDFVNLFEAAIVSEDACVYLDGRKIHYSELMDMDSLMAYWLINELFYNRDAMRKSTYFYKDYNDVMKMGPVWDYDWIGSTLERNEKEQWRCMFIVK